MILTKSKINYLQSKVLKSGNVKIKIVPIDDYINKRFTLIKLDVEGYEKEALFGAKNTVKKYCPKLAICAYHYQSDLWEIPLLIKKLNSDYRLYVRHYNQYVFDTVYYGV